MSTNTALRQRPALHAESTLHAAPQSPQLRVIEGTSPKHARLPILLLGLIVILVSITVPMLLQTRMAQTAFEIHEHQLQLNAINAQTWSAQTKLRSYESARTLEVKARELGMVPAQVSGTISLSTGVVEGGVVAR